MLWCRPPNRTAHRSDGPLNALLGGGRNVQVIDSQSFLALYTPDTSLTPLSPVQPLLVVQLLHLLYPSTLIHHGEHRPCFKETERRSNESLFQPNQHDEHHRDHDHHDAHVVSLRLALGSILSPVSSASLFTPL